MTVSAEPIAVDVRQESVSDRVERRLVQVRLTRNLVRVLDHYCVDTDQTRQSAIEHLIRVGMETETP